MSLRQKIIAGQPVFGSWLQTGSPTVAEIMAEEGFDFIAADMEHSDINEEGFGAFVRAVKAKTNPFARVRENDVIAIRRALDCGAQGIIVPLVNSVAEAQKAVSATRYPPEGVRGYAFCHANGWGRHFARYIQQDVNEIVVLVMVETRQAVEELDAILEVPGVDGVFLGPYDLSGSYGVPGELDHPLMRRAKRQVIEACTRKGKTAGQHIVTPTQDNVREALAEGYTLLVLGMDTQFVLDGAAQARRMALNALAERDS